MGSRFLTGVVLIGLFVVAFCLFIWLERHYRAKRSLLNPKAACVTAILSFIFVAFGMLAETLPHPGQAVGPGKELPPHIFAILPAAAFFCAALLTAIGLLFGAAFQLVSS